MQEGKSQKAADDHFDYKVPSWIEALRPAGFKTKSEKQFEAFVASKQKETEEMLKKSALHKEFLSKLKGLKEKKVETLF